MFSEFILKFHLYVKSLHVGLIAHTGLLCAVLSTNIAQLSSLGMRLLGEDPRF